MFRFIGSLMLLLYLRFLFCGECSELSKRLSDRRWLLPSRIVVLQACLPAKIIYSPWVNQSTTDLTPSDHYKIPHITDPNLRQILALKWWKYTTIAHHTEVPTSITELESYDWWLNISCYWTTVVSYTCLLHLNIIRLSKFSFQSGSTRLVLTPTQTKMEMERNSCWHI